MSLAAAVIGDRDPVSATRLEPLMGAVIRACGATNDCANDAAEEKAMPETNKALAATTRARRKDGMGYPFTAGVQNTLRE